MLKNIIKLFIIFSFSLFAHDEHYKLKSLDIENFNLQISLTKKEKEWIQNNQVVIGVEDWTPILFTDTGKDINGIAGEIFLIIKKKTGLKINIVEDLWDNLLNGIKSKTIDILPATYYTKERTNYGIYSNSYLSVSDYIYTKNENKSIHSIEDLSGKTLVIVKGHAIIPKIRKNFPNIEIIESRDLSDSIKKVLSSKADALYESQIAVEYKLSEELVFGMKRVPQNTFESEKLHIFIRNDKPILKSIINKALKTISIEEINRIKNKWILSVEDNKKYKIDTNLIETTSFEFFSLKKIVIILIVTFIIFYFMYKIFIKKKLLNSKLVMFNKLIILFEISLVVFLLGLIINLNKIDSTLAKLHEDKFYMMQVANRLRESSDELTHFARSYAVTNNKQFKLQYDLTLEIRNGIKPRPKGYNSIYWNLSRNERIKRHPSLQKESLAQIINKLPFSKEEKNKLKEAEKNSNALVAIEEKAFQAISKNNNKLAITLLYSKKYFDSKHKIMLPIDDFIGMLNYRLTKEIDNLKASIYKFFNYIFILLFVFIIGNVLLYFLLRKKINDPILYLIEAINKIKNNKKVEIKSFYKDEIGETIKEFFDMHNAIKYQQFRLEASREKFSRLFESSPDAIAILKNSKYVRCNEKALDTFGVANKEIFLKNTPNDYSPKFQKNGKLSKDLIIENIEKAMTKGYHRFEWLHKKLNTNETFYAEVILSLIVLDGEKHISSIVRDISERKALEEKISQNKLFVDSLLNSQEQLVITTDGRELKSCNNSFLNFFKVKSLKEFKKNHDCIAEKFEKYDSKDYLQEYTSEKDWIEYILFNKNSTHKVAIKDKNIVKIFTVTASLLPLKEKIWSAVFTDITELELQKKQTDLILSSVLLPLLITSKKTRKIKYANNYAENQYEALPGQLIGMDMISFYTYDNQREDILKQFKEKDSLKNYETRFKTLKGNEFDAILSLIEIEFKGEECYLGVASDITEQKDRELLINSLHKNVTDSIEYASLIQHAIIPANESFKKYFDDFFIIWEPKDTVGGDIYLFEELNNDECLLMVIDCTGHGVPGAFVTMLVKAIERQIITILSNNMNKNISPAWILKYFNLTMKRLLKQENSESISNAGFDGAIIYYNKKEKFIKYSGAEIPLFYIDDEFKIVKGNRQSIGYKKSDENYEFIEHKIKVEKGMQFYITTDGYIDQNGGDKSFPFGKRRFKNLVENYKQNKFTEQKKIFINNLHMYQNDEERNDDILLVGLKI